MTGSGSETEGFSYDEGQAFLSVIFTGVAGDSTLDAAKLFDGVSRSQTERRWGVEEGAVMFRKTYEQSMGALHDKFRAMEASLDDFTRALIAAGRALKEGDTAAAQEFLRATAPQKEQQETNEETEWSPGPYTDSSGVKPINEES